MTAKLLTPPTAEKPIKRLLRRKNSHQYFREGNWTDNPSQATTFGDVVEVAEVCARYDLKDVEMALRCEIDSEDVFSTTIR